jgi:CRISPR/Cas system-associated exonuclease Cas4 (RecB family)
MAERSLDGAIRFRKVVDSTGFTPAKLINALNQGYLEDRRPNKFTQKKTFSPSSIGYGHATCPRYWHIAFSGADFVENGDGMGVAVMASGTAAHSRIQGALKKAGVLVAEEVEIKLADPPIRGFIDVMVRVDDEVVVGEIKTTGEAIFNAKRTSMKPSPNHLFQILIYMKATGKKKGFLLYENRNTLEILVIEVDFTEANEAILENALEWMRTVYKGFEAEELPTRPFRNQTVKVCQNCPVNKVCWEELPDGDVKLPKMEVPTL